MVHDSRLGRAEFELSGIQRMWVQTFDQNDSIDNISHVPALIDGGKGNDVIHNLVNDPNSRLQLLKKINQIQPVEVSLVLGNEGSDQLFTGTGIIDKTKPANPINAALQQFGDSGITVLFGDHQVTPLGGNNYKFTEVANIATAKDSYFSSAAQLRHGFITKGNDRAGEGVFAFGVVTRSSSAT